MSNLRLQEYQRLAGVQSSYTEEQREVAPTPHQVREQVAPQPRKRGIAGVRQDIASMREEFSERLDRIESEMGVIKTEQVEIRRQQTSIGRLVEDIRYEVRPRYTAPAVQERVVYRDRPTPAPAAAQMEAAIRRPPPAPAPARSSDEKEKSRFELLEVD